MNNAGFFQLPPQFRLPQVGDTIHFENRTYYIGSPLGQGAFGQVFECHDDWDMPLVAKVLLPRNERYEQVEARWQGEVANLQALRHPNVTYIHDAFECESTFYLIIERCSHDLNRIIENPSINGERWLPHVASQVLRGLDYIHRQGFVHKDLHPGNIFIAWQHDPIDPDRDPVFRAKIGDLGISRLEQDIRIFNTILAQWMRPPEALDPQRFGVIGAPLDIYHAALGFLALLLGKMPQFTVPDVLAGAPRKTAESLHSPIGDVLARALRRRVAHRTQTALQFWKELRSVL